MTTLPLFSPILDAKVLNTAVRRYVAILPLGHDLEHDVSTFTVSMVPSMAVLIREQLELFETVRFELILSTSFECIRFHQNVMNRHMQVNFQAKTDHPVSDLNEIDDVIKNILQAYDHYVVDEDCFGWNFERCSYLRLSIFEYPSHKTETSSLAELALRVVNSSSHVYVQSCNAIPRDIQRCYGMKPRFLLKELEDVMNIASACMRRDVQWRHFALTITPLSSDIIQAAKDMFAARRSVSTSVLSTSRMIKLSAADVIVCHVNNCR